MLLLVAMLFLVLPLWRKAVKHNNVLRDEANLGILRDQSEELEDDLQNGLLTQEAYEQGKRELQARLIDEVKITKQSVQKPRNPAKSLALGMAIVLPIFTVTLYTILGNSEMMLPKIVIEADADGIVRSADELKKLEQKLDRSAKNPDDWWMLARSYTAMARYAEASKAYQKLVDIVPKEAQIWANYADVYAMANGKTLLNPRVAEMLSKALEFDGNNPTALALSGSAAMEGGDYVGAIGHWQKLVSQAKAGSEDARMFGSGIEQAKSFLAKQPGGAAKLEQLLASEASASAATQQAAQATAITGKVSLSPALLSQVAPTDIVFILARAAEGPKMPLAVLRKQVKDLPMEFTLDDSMAMQPQLKLSGFEQVVVVARVSKSGTPMGQTGDLEGTSATVKPGVKGLNIVIKSVLP